MTDVMLKFETTGEGDPVLFVHGFPLSRELWRPAAERLGDGWRCILPDLRGHGESPPTAAVSIADYSDDLVKLLDTLREWRSVVLVGLSMGGIIAFDFFRRYRLRLRGLVLCDCRANLDAPEGLAKREALAQAVLRGGSQAAAAAMLDNLFAPNADPKLKEKWRSIMASHPPEGVAAASRALAGREDSMPTLPKIDCPTLVIVGEADSITPPALHRELHATIPGSQFEIIPNAGHMAPAEQPDRFASVLRRFLTNLPR